MAKKAKKAKIVNQPIEFVWCGMVEDRSAGIGLHVDQRGEGKGVWGRAAYHTRNDAASHYRRVKPYLLVPNTPANRKRLGVKRA